MNNEEDNNDVDLEEPTTIQIVAEAKTSFVSFVAECKTNVLLFACKYEFRKPIQYNGLETKSFISLVSQISSVYSVFDLLLLLEAGADPNALLDTKTGNTLLHHCVRKGLVTREDYAVLHLLISAGADINWQNNRNQTPLMLACDTVREGNTKIVRLLLAQEGTKTELRDVGGSTALMLAIFKNNIWIVREFLLVGASVNRGSPSAYDMGGCVCVYDHLVVRLMCDASILIVCAIM